MKTRNSLSVALLSACVMCAGIAPAHAAMQTLIGSDFDITYDDALTGLFGSASLVGSTIFFTPTTFKAESLNGAGFVTATQTVNFRVTAHTGLDFSSISVSEAGDYKLRGTNSFVNVGGQVRAFDVANPFVQLTNNITATAPLTINDGANHDWTATAALNLASFATATTINVALEDLLEAYTEPTDIGPKLAFIEKKFAGVAINIVTTPVPEANTWAMMIAGLGLVGFQLRRRQNRIG